VYIPLEEGAVATMPPRLVFQDEAGQWWGERVGERYWTRRAAQRAAFEEHKQRFRTRETYRELLARAGGVRGADLEVAAAVDLLPAPRAGLAGKSRWYS
jgi:hypothetical protein